MWQTHFVFLCYEHAQEQSICKRINQTKRIPKPPVWYPSTLSSTSLSTSAVHRTAHQASSSVLTSGTKNTDGPCQPPPPPPRTVRDQNGPPQQPVQVPSLALHLKGVKPPHLNKLFCFLFAFCSFPLTCFYLSRYVQQALQTLATAACRLAVYRGRQGTRSSNWILMWRDSSVVRAPDLWLKGRGFESLLEQWENFLLPGRLSVLTLISVSVPPLCYHSST